MEKVEKVLTVNPHGVHSVTGIFQREIERRVSRYPSMPENLEKLSNVFHVSLENGLRLKRDKYTLLISWIRNKYKWCNYIRFCQYLMHPPLRMFNYYHRHLPNILEPLHTLLRKGLPWSWVMIKGEIKGTRLKILNRCYCSL